MARIPFIPVICGPTASGKTGAAFALADEFPLEIISADSRQVVKHLDIGTAKPTPEENAKVTTHLIDIIEPGQRYSAFDFIEDAKRLIEEIQSRDKIPVIAGGTGLYMDALTRGMIEIDSQDMEIRQRLERETEELGAGAMHKRLEKIDPLEAAKIHPNNKVKVIRALEIYYLTGKPKSEIIVTGIYKKKRI